MITAGVITLSDKGSRGERVDLSGPEVTRLLKEIGIETTCSEVVPDEADVIERKLIEFVDERRLDLVVTTGGTGVSPRDVTPEATLKVIDREIPGMAEAMRRESMLKTPHAMISTGRGGNPQDNAHHQSSRQSERRPGKSGRDPSCTQARHRKNQGGPG